MIYELLMVYIDNTEKKESKDKIVRNYEEESEAFSTKHQLGSPFHVSLGLAYDDDIQV